jgi:competence protein ComEC
MGVWSPRESMSRSQPGLLQQAGAAFGHALLHEADRWFLWVPVLFAAGIGLYFSLENEPPARIAAAGVIAAAALLLLARGRPVLWALAAATLCAALGFADAKLRTTILSTPILERPAGAVTVDGWVERVEARGAKGNRLTLRVIAVRGARDPVTLRKARVTSRLEPPPVAGQAVTLRAILRPLPEPVMPGGFDFARGAWFAGIDASGFSISAPEPLADPPKAPLILQFRAAVDLIRKGVDARIRAALPSDKAAIASALITGGRGRIPEETLQALRHSGLAHVLAISGLHMALMDGSFY